MDLIRLEVNRINELRVVECKHIIDPLEEGVLYVSQEFKLSIHLCACGCKGKTVLPFSKIVEGKEQGWSTTKNSDGTMTLRPSVGNWSGQSPYHAHYYITNNKIEWL